MSIIIDANCFANVFSRNSANHADFKPVLDWIIAGKGIIVFGGTKYKKELRKNSKYLTFINLLKDVKKVYIGNTENIDQIQSQIEAINSHPDFDDPHLPAIVIDTKCKIICSLDKRSIPFVKNCTIYPDGIRPPVYYTNISNITLLSDRYIDKSFKPLIKLNKANKVKIQSVLERLESN